LNVNRRHRH